MKHNTVRLLAVRHVAILLALAVGLTGCQACRNLTRKVFKRSDTETVTPPDVGVTGPTVPTQPLTPTAPEPPAVATEPLRPTAPPEALPLERVHFDYDSSVLTPAAQKILDQNVEWLKTNSAVRVQIEGHCDERGTDEYNMALGERRANSVRDYLVKNGIDASRLFTITYGEQRPIDPGHDESAWWKNRRAEFSSLR